MTSRQASRAMLFTMAMVGGAVFAPGLYAQPYTVESASVQIGADVLADKSILVTGEPLAGTVSNATYTIEIGQVPCLLAALKGDFDEDFDVDFDDLRVFVEVLLGTDTDPAHVLESDINGDNFADGKDIDAFVASVLSL